MGQKKCFEQIDKMPAELRVNITDPETQQCESLHGGGSDFAYIPGNQRDEFLSIIEHLFGCFFEIALPMVLEAISGPMARAMWINSVSGFATAGPMPDGVAAMVGRAG